MELADGPPLQAPYTPSSNAQGVVKEVNRLDIAGATMLRGPWPDNLSMPKVGSGGAGDGRGLGVKYPYISTSHSVSTTPLG